MSSFKEVPEMLFLRLQEEIIDDEEFAVVNDEYYYP